MAHELYTLSNGKKSMAYVGEKPWHGLGQVLTRDAPIEAWTREAGLDWKLNEAQVLFMDSNKNLRAYPNKILVRSDNEDPLSLVSEGYKVVQPGEVLSFYADLIKGTGITLETAGSLRGGRKYWALAKMNRAHLVQAEDGLEGYLLLASSCDGSLATTAMFTAIRVVCANTMSMALEGGGRYIKVPHNRTFDHDKVKAELGLGLGAWDQFIDKVEVMAKRKVALDEARELVTEVIMGDEDPPQGDEVALQEWEAARRDNKMVNGIVHLFNGNAMGAKFKSSKGTAWGLVNATTEYLDYQRSTRTQDRRLELAWFGDSLNIKERVFERCYELAR